MEQPNNNLSKLITVRFHGVKVPFQLHDSGVKAGEANECGAHTHRHYELKCVIAGKCVQTVEGREIVTGHGDVLLVRPYQSHELRIVGEEDLVMQNLSFTIKSSDKAEDEKRIVADLMTELLCQVQLIPSGESGIVGLYKMINREICENESV